jgi:hypothetical protein
MMEHEKGMNSKQGIEMLDNVRRICNSLPEIEEIIDGLRPHYLQNQGKIIHHDGRK